MVNLNLLVSFCTVANVNSFSKAAKTLHLTQPTISGHIQALENYYNCKLFDRSNHGVTLTPEGEIVYEYARKIIQTHTSLQKKLDEITKVKQQELVVGASTCIGNYILPCSIWKFYTENSKAKIKKMIVANSEQIYNDLMEGNINLALVDGPVKNNNEQLVVKNIYRDYLVVITPPKLPWINRDNISLKELANEPFILREQGSGVRKNLEGILNKNDMGLGDLNVVTEIGSMDSIKIAVELGQGISVAPYLAVKKELQAGSVHSLRILDSDDNVNYSLMYLKYSLNNKIAKHFIYFISNNGRRAFC